MEVIITEWGLQSYIKLKNKAVFSDDDYKYILRPDAELLKVYPNDLKFCNDRFWGPAKFANKITKYGHKMKWHNLGNGNVQLRLCVVVVETKIEKIKEERAFLCTSYVKDDKSEKLEMAGLKTKIRKILDGTFFYRGRL
jgi:hypothetical protein